MDEEQGLLKHLEALRKSVDRVAEALTTLDQSLSAGVITVTIMLAFHACVTH